MTQETAQETAREPAGPPPPRPMDGWVPHRGAMSLLDGVEHFEDQSIVVRVTVPASGLFVAGGGMPAWVGIELMAQSVAAYAGCHARQKGQAVELGFLLGTRKFVCNVAHFPAGAELRIHGLRSLEDDNGMGVFECHLTGVGIQASARLNVFRPPQAANYLAELKDQTP